MTDKELRTLDEMLTNLEIWSTWNKTFANEMIGICSKMRNLLADRKTENNSEIPNNSTSSKMEQVEDEPQKLDCRNKKYYSSCEYANKCHPTVCFKALDEFKEKLKDEPQTDCAWK